MANDKWAFFYHFYKAKNAMSVHFRGQCYVVPHVHCYVPCTTKWNKRQPKLVMHGYAKDVIITNDGATII